MMDSEDEEKWRQCIPVKKSTVLYMGQYLTASQWAYLARQDNQYCLVLVQSWFKKVMVTPAKPTQIYNWELPLGAWVSIPGHLWQIYEVYDDAGE